MTLNMKRIFAQSDDTPRTSEEDEENLRKPIIQEEMLTTLKGL